MKRVIIGGIVGLLLVGLVAYFVVSALPKPWPILPDYPTDRARQYNRLTIGDSEKQITTFEVNDLSGATSYKAVNLNYVNKLFESGWDYLPGRPLDMPSIENNYYRQLYRPGDAGITFFGQTFLASCSPFRLAMQVEQLDAITGHMKVTLTQTRTRC